MVSSGIERTRVIGMHSVACGKALQLFAVAQQAASKIAVRHERTFCSACMTRKARLSANGTAVRGNRGECRGGGKESPHEADEHEPAARE